MNVDESTIAKDTTPVIIPPATGTYTSVSTTTPTVSSTTTNLPQKNQDKNTTSTSSSSTAASKQVPSKHSTRTAKLPIPIDPVMMRVKPEDYDQEEFRAYLTTTLRKSSKSKAAASSIPTLPMPLVLTAKQRSDILSADVIGYGITRYFCSLALSHSFVVVHVFDIRGGICC